MSPRSLQLPFPAPPALSKLQAVLLTVFHLAGPHGLAAAESPPANDGALLTLPVRFHVTQGATIAGGGVNVG